MTHRESAGIDGGAREPSRGIVSGQDDRRFAQLFDGLPNPIADVRVVNEQPIIAAVNQRFTERFGTDESATGTPITEYTHPHSKEGEAERLVADIVSGDHSETIISRSSAAATAKLRRTIIPYERDGVQRAFLVYSDVTDGAQQRAALESENQQLEKLAAMLSHDLRNPVNTAQGWLEHIETAIDADDSDGDDAVVRVKRALDRIETMIDKTLTLTQNPEIIENTEMVPLDTLAERCWETADTDTAELIVDDRFNLLCNKDQMTRLLENVFQNAVDHNSDSITVRIGIHNRLATTTRDAEEPSEAFYIADDGCGIPQVKRDDVLEYGETTLDGGAGLGLSIVKRITEAHGWDLTVTETFNGGAKFVFNNATLHGRIPTDGA